MMISHCGVLLRIAFGTHPDSHSSLNLVLALVSQFVCSCFRLLQPLHSKVQGTNAWKSIFCPLPSAPTTNIPPVSQPIMTSAELPKTILLPRNGINLDVQLPFKLPIRLRFGLRLNPIIFFPVPSPFLLGAPA